ncbi:mannonate dehydratase [Conexibacter sp. CPCC 206217]|uniref:mannonate dehydratase n=1 Tax=Conexibacter sp. CPCC 206217 TaxID=3064574 RepID=UPI00271EE4D8|nr:mannonate dehydratase [Conexibacter sp. CPCC 206217]MDO8208780.1 mannonate dehydratase [Conexibacter sp. CPCC 206217]
MIEFAEYLHPRPDAFWTTLRQVGVERAVSTLDRSPNPMGHRTADLPWGRGAVRQLKQRYEDMGLELVGIEDSPPLDRTRLGIAGREEEIEHFCTLVRSMGDAGIPMLCYNWMAVIPWLRTSVTLRGRAGALVTGFDAEALRDSGPTWAGTVPAEQFWDAFEHFIKRVAPVAEEAGVRLALHPDDPPLAPLRGMGRIMNSLDAFERVLEFVDTPANSLTLCQGNWTLMTDDVPGAIRHFGGMGRIAFGHFRDVRGTAERFVETFHDEGQTDMLQAMIAWHEIDFDGVLRCDHVPTLEGDSNMDPSYSFLARLHAIGYMTGLREAAVAALAANGPTGMEVAG